MVKNRLVSGSRRTAGTRSHAYIACCGHGNGGVPYLKPSHVVAADESGKHVALTPYAQPQRGPTVVGAVHPRCVAARRRACTHAEHAASRFAKSQTDTLRIAVERASHHYSHLIERLVSGGKAHGKRGVTVNLLIYEAMRIGGSADVTAQSADEERGVLGRGEPSSAAAVVDSGIRPVCGQLAVVFPGGGRNDVTPLTVARTVDELHLIAVSLAGLHGFVPVFVVCIIVPCFQQGEVVAVGRTVDSEAAHILHFRMPPREIHTLVAVFRPYSGRLLRHFGHHGRGTCIDGEEQSAIAQHLVGTVVGPCQPCRNGKIRKLLLRIHPLHFPVMMIYGLEGTGIRPETEAVVVRGYVIERITLCPVKSRTVERSEWSVGMPRVIAAPVFHAAEKAVVAGGEEIVALIPRHAGHRQQSSAYAVEYVSLVARRLLALSVLVEIILQLVVRAVVDACFLARKVPRLIILVLISRGVRCLVLARIRQVVGTVGQR